MPGLIRLELYALNTNRLYVYSNKTTALVYTSLTEKYFVAPMRFSAYFINSLTLLKENISFLCLQTCFSSLNWRCKQLETVINK